jgi:hypothetical protein
MKQCTKCGIIKPPEEFYKDKRHQDGLYSSCKDCWNVHGAIRRALAKENILKEYGGICHKCGEDDFRFLTIGHSFNDGASDRRMLGVGAGWKFYEKVRLLGYPKDRGYVVECFDCNCSAQLHPKKIIPLCTKQDCKLKLCSKCKNVKHVHEFNARHDRKNGRSWCRDCQSADSHLYKIREKENCISAYGNTCQCCGQARIELLTIGHGFNNGAVERKEMNNGGGSSFYIAIRKLNYPKDRGYIVECYNCNMGAAANSGICPHQEDKTKLQLVGGI